MKRKILAAILAVCMMITLLPQVTLVAHADSISKSSGICLADLECVDEGHYTGNEGDARVYRLDKAEFNGFAPTGHRGATSRNGNIGLDGTVYENGFEVWIARWNFGDNISWAYRTFKLGGNYHMLTGSSAIIKSYNTKDYDVTAYFYDGDKILYSFSMTPQSNEFDFAIDVTGVDELKVMVKDNKKAAGGTSYALYNLFLDGSAGSRSDAFCEKTYIANIWANQRNDTAYTPESKMIQDLMGYDSFSETIYTSLKNNRSFANALAKWNGMRLTFDPVNGVDELFLSEKHEIYEMLVLDLIERRAKAEGEAFSNVFLDAVDISGNVGKQVTKYKKIIDNLIELVDVPNDQLLEYLKTYKFDPNSTVFTSFYASLNDLSDTIDTWKNNEFIESVSTIAKAASDISDFYQRLTLYMLAYDMNHEMLALLGEMKQQTNNVYLKEALSNVIAAYDNAAVVSAVCTLNFAWDTTVTFMDECFDTISKAFPCYEILRQAYNASTTFCNLMFNTSDIIDAYYTAEATTNFIKANKQAIFALENRFKTTGSETDAGAYVYAVSAYFDVMEIDLKTGADFVKKASAEGLVNRANNLIDSVVNWICGEDYKSSYDSFVESSASISENLCMMSDSLLQSWKYNEGYLRSDYPEIYPVYVEKDLSQDVYTPEVLSAQLDKAGSVQVTWTVPSSYTDANTNKTHFLWGFYELTGVELSELAGGKTSTFTAPFTNVPATTNINSTANFDTFPKKYSARAFAEIDGNNVYTKSSPQLAMYSPCGAVTMSIAIEGGSPCLSIYDPSNTYYDNIRYHILRSSDGGEFTEVSTIIRNLLHDGHRTTFHDASAKVDVKYTYKVISEMTFQNGKTLYSEGQNDISLQYQNNSFHRTITIKDNRMQPQNRAVGSESIELSWTPIDGAAGYVIYRLSSYGIIYQEIATVAGQESYYLDSDVSPNVSYEYFLLPYWNNGAEKVFRDETYMSGRAICEVESDPNPGQCTHQFDDGEVIWEPGESDGIVLYTCNICGATKTEVLPAAPHTHSYIDTVTAPTCTKQGYTTHTCSCGDSYVDSYVDALGHDFGEWIATKEATEDEAGEEARTCSRCGETETRETAKLDCPSAKFVDVNSKAWYHKAIDFALANGIFSGADDTHFNPNGKTTRAMFVAVLWRLDGRPESAAANPFVDVKAGSYYEKAVIWAAANKIVAGTDAVHFNPNGNVTREQVAAFLYRYASAKDYDLSASADLSKFPDASKISNYAKDNLAWAVGAGLISGSKDAASGTVYLDPKGNATRAQVAQILMMFTQKIAK